MAHIFRCKVDVDTHSVTDQNFKTMAQTIEEYLQTGVLDIADAVDSFDYNSAEDVDLRADRPQDVDLYDAASGLVDPLYKDVDPAITSSSPSSGSQTAAAADTVDTE